MLTNVSVSAVEDAAAQHAEELANRQCQNQIDYFGQFETSAIASVNVIASTSARVGGLDAGFRSALDTRIEFSEEATSKNRWIISVRDECDCNFDVFQCVIIYKGF